MHKNFSTKRPIIIIAEIASAHSGNLDKQVKLIEEASRTGADFVKVQVFRSNELVSEQSEQFEEMSQIELEPGAWGSVLEFSKDKKIDLIAEVFDRKSLGLLSGHKAIKGFKIPTADITDLDFINMVCTEKKPIFLGVGGATKEEIDRAASCLLFHEDIHVTLMHGIQSFPTDIEDCLLDRISYLKEVYKFEVGYADHIDAEESELARNIPAMSLAAGATVIEKHIILERETKGFDYYSSLTPEEFKHFVKYIHTISEAIGVHNNLELTAAEKTYRNNMKRFAVLNKGVEKNSLLKDASLSYLRTPNPGMTRSEVFVNKNKRFKESKPAGHIISVIEFD